MLLSTPSPLATLDSRRPSPIPTSLSLTNKHQKSTSSLFRLDRDDGADESHTIPQPSVNEPTPCIECTPDAFRVEGEYKIRRGIGRRRSSRCVRCSPFFFLHS